MTFNSLLDGAKTYSLFPYVKAILRGVNSAPPASGEVPPPDMGELTVPLKPRRVFRAISYSAAIMAIGAAAAFVCRGRR